LYDLSIECQLDLFDKVVVPVLLYACEVWGYENIDIIERVHLRFIKHILNLKSSTPSFMVYGETGRYPLYVTVYTRMASFWAKLLCSDENKICKTIYLYLYKQYKKGLNRNPWFSCMNNIFESCGLSYIWNEQNTTIFPSKWVSSAVNQILKDQYIQKWHSEINESSKGLCYSTPRDERLCHLCNCNKIGDEYHYLMECVAFTDLREKVLPFRYYFVRPNTLKFGNLLSTSKKTLHFYFKGFRLH
jgi:hypothetical protein